MKAKIFKISISLQHLYSCSFQSKLFLSIHFINVDIFTMKGLILEMCMQTSLFLLLRVKVKMI